MKRVTDYTAEELLTVDEEQLNKLIEIECMIEGVERIDPPGPEPTFGENLQLKTFYTLGNNVLFSSAEKAQEASRLATHEMAYTSLNGKYSAKKKSTDSIQMNTYYDADELDSIKADKASFEKAHALWARKNSAYLDYCKERMKAESQVYDAINNAAETIGEEKRRLEQYKHFLDLAEDAAIAGRFFTDMLVKQGWSEEEAQKELDRCN